MEMANSGTLCLFNLRRIGDLDYSIAPGAKQDLKMGFLYKRLKLNLLFTFIQGNS